jgi:hypothetical protein
MGRAEWTFRGCSHRSQRSRLQHGKRKLKGRLSAALFLSSSEGGARMYRLSAPCGPRNPAATSAAYEAPMIFPYWLEAFLDLAPAFLILAALVGVWWLRPAR